MAFESLTLPDISEDAPAGADMEFDPDFGALDRAMQGKPEVQYGDSITPAEPPDWKEARALAQSLTERTHDLRVLAHMAVARLHTEGLAGYAETLAQIRDQIENRWEKVYPLLDPEDDNDPTARSNALMRLQDPANVQRMLRDMPLAGSPRTGAVAWRDIAIFNGALEPPEGTEKPTEVFIRGVFANTDRERLALLREAVELAVREVAAIPSVFDAHAGATTGPDFSNLGKLLGEIRDDLVRFEPAEEVVAEMPAEEASGAGGGGGGGGAPVAAAGRGFASVRQITSLGSREDALHALELASGYFKAHEPSSPLPMLIDRARRLAGMEFMEILREIAPDGLGQAQILAGPQAEGQQE